MPDETPLAALTAAVPLLPDPFREAHARLFHPHHLARLAGTLARFHSTGVRDFHPPPYFAAERTPPLASAYAPFAGAMRAWASDSDQAAPAAFAAALVAAGTEGLLVLLGQRLTPASRTDPRAIPPTPDELLEAAARPHRPGQALSVAARALDKHVGRSAMEWWAPVAGPADVRNERARTVVESILAGATWWNVFGHFQHELVYEARLPSGHGARWRLDPLRFVGFLEPFEAGPDASPDV